MPPAGMALWGAGEAQPVLRTGVSAVKSAISFWPLAGLCMVGIRLPLNPPQEGDFPTTTSKQPNDICRDKALMQQLSTRKTPPFRGPGGIPKCVMPCIKTYSVYASLSFKIIHFSTTPTLDESSKSGCSYLNSLYIKILHQHNKKQQHRRSKAKKCYLCGLIFWNIMYN